MHGKDTSLARDAALAWFVRLRDEAASEDDKATFRAWLRADPAHAEAYGAVVQLWSGLDRVRNRPTPRGSAGDPPDLGRRRSLHRLALAASLAAVAGLGAYALAPVGLLADHRTAAGEQRTVTLKDGSSLLLNTASAVSVEFDAARRRITLHGGEVYLEVAKDPARPFVVEAGAGRIEVLGTAFAVRRSGEDTRVIVTENRVTVSAPGGRPTVVMAGQEVRVTAAGLGAVEPSDAGAALAWRRGRLVFDTQLLGEVLSELERYRKGRIVIVDSGLAELPVTGSFSIGNAEATLETIERTLPVRLYRLSDLLVLVLAAS